MLVERLFSSLGAVEEGQGFDRLTPMDFWDLT